MEWDHILVTAFQRYHFRFLYFPHFLRYIFLLFFSPDRTFQYAFCLSKSLDKSELRYAITILDSLVKEGYEHQVDCMFGAVSRITRF